MSESAAAKLKLMSENAAGRARRQAENIRGRNIVADDGHTARLLDVLAEIIDVTRNELAEAKGKLDIIVREGTGEPPDSLGADYGGTGWEKSEEVKAIRAERAEAGKAEEEFAHVRRELAEMRGQFVTEETSGTLAIYESFKTALEPFGYENLNVRVRVELLVAEWGSLRISLDNLTETVRQMEQLILPLDLDPKPVKKMSEVIADVPKRVAEILERTRNARRDRDDAMHLLGDALIQLHNAGVSTFLLKPAISDGAKRDLIRMLHLSMGDDTVEDTPKKPGVGVGVVCFQDGRILLGKRHPSLDGGGQWELPGGSLEWGETWPGAARREVEEETGIAVLRNYRFLTAKEDHRPEDDKHNAIIFVRFDARGHAKVMESDKSTEWGWYLLDDLPDGPMFPALRELLTVDRHLLA